MNVSTQSLFHYTSFENLLGIIDNGFKYSNFEEDLPFTMPEGSFFAKFNETDLIRYYQHIASVCFCDLPFDRIEDHRNQYGQYCIGMSKEWAMKNGVTPVRYIHKGSPDIQNEIHRMLTQYLPLHEKHNYNLIDFFATFLKDTDNNFDFSSYQKWLEECPTEAKKILVHINSYFLDVVQFSLYSMGFLRSYKGTWRDRVTQQNIERIFYNEREWRALKTHEEQDYLTFELRDINHIIILTEEERKTLIDRIKAKFNAAQIPNIEEKVSLHKDITPEMVKKM